MYNELHSQSPVGVFTCIASVSVTLSSDSSPVSPQALILRGWVDLTCGRETYMKKCIKYFDEALSGYVSQPTQALHWLEADIHVSTVH